LIDTCVRDVLERREFDWRVVRCDDVKMALARRRERRRGSGWELSNVSVASFNVRGTSKL
jgi:hypothetical protein